MQAFFIDGVDQKLIADAQPAPGVSVNVCEAERYNVGADYKHVTLRAACDVRAGTTVMVEQPVSYTATGAFFNKHSVDARVARVQMPGSTAESLRKDKEAFFMQQWPAAGPFFVGCDNRDYLQLTCVLIHTHPDVAIQMASGSYFGERPLRVASATFQNFVAAMQTLSFLRTPRAHVAPWIVYADFKRLYDAVCANACRCATVVSNELFALGLYPVMCRLNHSCRPNCVRIGTPLGMYLVALKDVRSGEELTISYCAEHVVEYVDSEVVKSRLMRNWRFTCACDFCTAGGGANTVDDVATADDNDQDQLGAVMADETVANLLARLSVATLKSDFATVLDVCENIRGTHGPLLESNATFAYIVSRNFVRMVRHSHATTTRCIQVYHYWACLYQSAVVTATTAYSLPALWAQFYQTAYSLLLTNLNLWRDESARSWKVQSNTTGETIETPLSFAIGDLFDNYTILRGIARDVLGSPWFLWTELAMYDNVQVLLRELENGVNLMKAAQPIGTSNTTVSQVEINVT